MTLTIVDYYTAVFAIGDKAHQCDKFAAIRPTSETRRAYWEGEASRLREIRKKFQEHIANM